MRVNTDTIKTTAFALKYRLMGYKLLQNPKGTNPHEVTMIKSWFGFDGDYFDKFYSNIRIHRKKVGDKFITERTDVLTEYLMNPENFTYSGKNKNIYVSYKNSNGEIKAKSREKMSDLDKARRPLPDFAGEVDKYIFGEELFSENRNKQSYYYPRPSLIKRIIVGGLYKYVDLVGYETWKRAIEPSFWQVLKTNLKGGGIVIR